MGESGYSLVVIDWKVGTRVESSCSRPDKKHNYVEIT